MKITLIDRAQCLGELDFKPKAANLSGIHGFAINRTVVAGFKQNLFVNYELGESSSSASEVLAGLYPGLSFIEVAELLNAASPLVNKEALLSRYGYSYDQRSESFLELALKLPPEFQKWAIDKRVGPFDLAALASFDLTRAEPLLLQIASQALSKNEGVEALVLGIELLLIDYKASEILTDKNWLVHLKNLRYPKVLSQDADMVKKMADISWPKFSQSKWLRKGDQSGVELKLFFNGPEDFIKQTSSIESQLGKLWTKN